MRVDEELLHYGVKGMKWGVKKKQTVSTVAKSVAKKAIKSVKKSYGYPMARNPRRLTNRQLQEYISRLKMEREYKTLLKDRGKIKKGESFVKNALRQSGESTLREFSKYWFATGLNTVFGKDIVKKK